MEPLSPMQMTLQPVATISNTDKNILVEDCEKEAANIIKFMSANRLSANSDKTHIMIIRRKVKEDEDEIVINIGNDEIKESAQENLLGMIVDNDLSWKSHVKNLVKKLNFRLYTLRRLSHIIPRSMLKTVADGIFLSLIRYGLPVYCPLRLKENDPNTVIIKDLKKVFHNCLRLLNNKTWEDHAPLSIQLIQKASQMMMHWQKQEFEHEELDLNLFNPKVLSF